MTIFLIIIYVVLVVLAIAICRVSADEEMNELRRKDDRERR